MFDAVDLARTQVGAEQMTAAEDIERQEAIVVVVAMEETPLLIAVHGDVGGVEIQNDALRRPLVRGDELLDKYLMDSPGGFPVGPLLEAVLRGYAGEPTVTLHRHLQRNIIAQMLMISPPLNSPSTARPIERGNRINGALHFVMAGSCGFLRLSACRTRDYTESANFFMKNPG